MDKQIITNENGKKILIVQFKGAEVDMNIGELDISYGSIEEEGKLIQLSFVIDTLSYSISFDSNGQIKLSLFDIIVGKVKTSYNSKHMEELIKLLKYIVNEQLSKEGAFINTLIENVIHGFYKEPTLTIEDYKINLPIIDLPQFLIYNSITGITEEKRLINQFLGNYSFSNKTYLLVFGMKGQVISQNEPKSDYDFPEAINMTIIPEFLNKDVQLLISDYSINTLLYKMFLSKELNVNFPLYQQYLPFTADVKGYSTIIPEYSIKYPNKNYNILTLIEVNKYFMIAPVMSSSLEGLILDINFKLEFRTYLNPPSEYVIDLDLNITKGVKVLFESNGTDVSIRIEDYDIKRFDVNKNEINTSINNLYITIPDLLNKTVIAYVNRMVKDIKVSEMIKQFSRFEIRDIDVAIN